MKCPIDDSDLVMSERQGIEIDYCPKCRGVWLDRGELDKLIERASPVEPARPAPVQQQRPPQYEPRHDDRHDRGRPYYKKRKSLLDEIFDF